MFTKHISIVATLLLLVAFVGCETKTATHSETHTGPESFSEAAEQLVTMKNQIRDGLAAGDVDAAHGPLHEVGHLLENMVTLAQKEKLSEEQLSAVEGAKETLFDAFGEIDKTLHGKEGATYEEKSEAIDAAIKVVVEAAGVTGGS